MTKEEIESKIEELENRIWLLEMKDRLSHEDFEVLRKWRNEKFNLEKQLTKIN